MSYYPVTNILKLNQNNTIYTYTIIKEGFYPSNNMLKYTFSRSGDNTQYKLPNQYLIHTSWGRRKSKHTIKCEINYINTLPIFKIGFGDGQELEREREKKYQSRFLKPFNMLGNTMKIKRVRKFGELISDSFNNVVKSSFHPDDNFALQEIHFKVQDKNIQVNFENRDLEKENKKNEAFLKVIDQGLIARDSYRKMANKIPISILNISNFSSFNLINENLNINNSEVEEEVLKYVGKAGYHRVTDILIYIIPDDTLNLQKSDYHFTVILYPGNENYETLQKVIEPMISELNDLSIHGLKDLTGKVWTIILYFSSDWKFLAIILGFNSANSKYFCPWCLCTKKDIGNINKTWTIEKNIDQIKTAFLNNEKPPPVIQELKAQNQFNNLTRTKIIDEMRRISVTFYFWQEQGTQNWEFTSLMGDDTLNLQKSDYHFTVILYPGNENYETLQKVIEPMISELNDLSIHGLKDLTGKVWTIILYFSSDWKFLAIILGFNSANSKYFCPWCLCTKKDIGNINKTWTIEKNIDQIKTAFLNNEKPPPGHIKPPLLSMISLDHYIPDELHIITKIIDEMRRISVTFYFWQEQGTQNWEFTSLMGGDKEIVPKDFNFEIIFDKERACLINKLWRDFYQLYKNIKLKETNSIQFTNQAKQWLNLFLTPSQGVPNTVNFKMGLYRPTDVMPYMHILVNHLSEFMERHRFSLSDFSCSPVEKKNHDQVSAFFRKTMKDGGKKLERKSAIFEILDYENPISILSKRK
ncbi:hypothetical protein Glove_94g12 [Diversispora epigaea]|uniref:Uncharacterized protein n=1 Tax=Diversispora epigaea TaxID=1348612 RepID=A0A397JFI9_9GLOM|nr:hypothetical protein Glove_94g12 [Diversispora epigaea]